MKQRLVFQNISWNLMDVWIQIIIFFWIVSAENSVENVVIFIRHYGNFLLHWFNSSHGNYSRAETIQGRNLFQGGNYSRAETIPGRKLFAEIWCIEISSTLWPHCLLLMHLFHCVKKLKLNASNIWQVNALFFLTGFYNENSYWLFCFFSFVAGFGYRSRGLI